MVRHVNPSGYVRYDNESELCKELETLFFPTFFDKGWKPIDGVTKEVWLTKKKKWYDGLRIDYFGYKNKIQVYVEVKNWFVTSNDIAQISIYALRLNINRTENELIVICGGIEKIRREILVDHCGVTEIILTKDIKELKSEELVYWM